MSAETSSNTFDVTLLVDSPAVAYDRIRTNPFVVLLPRFFSTQSESDTPLEFANNPIENASWFTGSYLLSYNAN